MGVDTALPVAIDLTGPQAPGLRRTVEGMLGWQVVDDATGHYMPAVVRFVAVDTPPSEHSGARMLVVAADDTTRGVAQAMAVHGARGAVDWPCDADVLAAAVDRIASRPVEPAAGRLLRVGGVCGGVGTTTSAIALAGLVAWRGRTVLAVVHGDAPVPQVRQVPAGASGSPDLFARATRIDGVPGARIVRVESDRSDGFDVPVDDTIDLTVVDGSVDLDVDVLVGRPDRRLLEQVGRSTASTVIVNGTGPASPRDLLRVVQGRRVVRLPWSVRVARADLHRRVPASLPGSWLRELVPIAEHLAGAPRSAT